jgi:agmatine deiminase
MLTWPHAHSDWAQLLASAEATYLNLAREISRRERVLIVCYDDDHRQHINQRLQQAGIELAQCRLAIAPSNDTWARDHGPITIREDGELTLLDFVFNGWGNKYDAELDNQITRLLLLQQVWGDHPVQTEDFVLEGGGIESDGTGTLLVTRHCLLAPTRNPHLDREQIEQYLREKLGVQRILWLEHGHLAGDDTDSHIDTLARFCDAQTIAYVASDDAQDEHHAALNAMAQELAALRTTNGQPYQLVPLPLPAAQYNMEGQRLPATYANFLIINDAVLVPTYNDPKDKIALRALEQCFPGRDIVGIDCCALIQQFGSLHCVTMQLPSGVL